MAPLESSILGSDDIGVGGSDGDGPKLDSCEHTGVIYNIGVLTVLVMVWHS